MLTINKDDKDITIPLVAKVAQVAEEQAARPPNELEDRLFGISNTIFLGLVAHNFIPTIGRILEVVPTLRQEIVLAMSAAILLDRTIKSQGLTVRKVIPNGVIPDSVTQDLNEGNCTAGNSTATKTRPKGTQK